MSDTPQTPSPRGRGSVPAIPVGSDRDPTRIVVGGGPSELVNPRWGEREYAHEDEVEMLVDAPAALEGRTVRFVVEHCVQGNWEPLAEATGRVRNGTAVGLARVEHPSARLADDLHFPAGVDTGPRTMRFKASLS